MIDAPPVLLTRDDLATGLRELVRRLQNADSPVRIQLIGGAALALCYVADRHATVDIDAILDPAETVLAAARDVAVRERWPDNWLNDAARIFLPSGFGLHSAEWRTVFDHGRVIVDVATPETLLAMKLHAVNRRGRREQHDLAVLLPLCDVGTVDQAESHYGDYYPGDTFTTRAVAVIEAALSEPRVVRSPPFPDLGPAPVQ